jgi:hypothetical protein
MGVDKASVVFYVPQERAGNTDGPLEVEDWSGETVMVSAGACDGYVIIDRGLACGMAEAILSRYRGPGRWVV